MTEHSSHPPLVITKKDITGLILAGGKGTRMGGVDKGLVSLKENRLIDRAVQHLSPQVSQLFISCNRNIETYQSLGYETVQDFYYKDCGPLSGIYNALLQCQTPYLAVVPVDSVSIPTDLVMRLSSVINSRERGCSYAHDGERTQPLFALIFTQLREDLDDFLSRGERRTHAWMRQHDAISVDFSDEQSAFTNINDLETLNRWNTIEK
ncbi:MAG: molybdenum cofactor guanylyltransferase [Pseudomonadales bacterium]|nr:molybdenum cofactor guanylyltransferase [Pseudomonadales bacterium]